jgi:hypothetical protein
MQTLNHNLKIPKNLQFRFSQDIVFMKVMADMLTFTNFRDYTFEQALRYLRVETKLPIAFLRKKLLAIYKELGIVITFNNTIPPTHHD